MPQCLPVVSCSIKPRFLRAVHTTLHGLAPSFLRPPHQPLPQGTAPTLVPCVLCRLWNRLPTWLAFCPSATLLSNAARETPQDRRAASHRGRDFLRLTRWPSPLHCLRTSGQTSESRISPRPMCTTPSQKLSFV